MTTLLTQLPTTARAAVLRAVVVADLDGTLAFDALPPGAAVQAALRSLLARTDIRLAFATSRPLPAVRRLMGALAPGLDLICCNGAQRITRDGRVSSSPLAGAVTRDIVAELITAGADFCLDYGSHFLASSPAALPWQGTTERVQLDPEQALRHRAGVLKVSATSSRPLIIDAVLQERIELVQHERRGDLDIVARGVNKATAVQRLYGVGVPVIALGNDTNDRELLLQADHGVVVGNGLPDLDRHRHLRRIPPTDTAVAAALRQVHDQVDSIR